jgi:hypothetical protein
MTAFVQRFAALRVPAAPETIAASSKALISAISGMKPSSDSQRSQRKFSKNTN